MLNPIVSNKAVLRKCVLLKPYTVVSCAGGVTKEFKVNVGLHQGSTLSSFVLLW